MRIKPKTVRSWLLDGDTWYLLRIDDAQQVQILQTVYPEFAGVEVVPGTMEAVE